jgi:hypothetical protein
VSSIKNVNFHVLIFVVSFALQLSVSLNIHNQCQDIDLTSPVYFTHGGRWHIVPEQEIDINTVMRNHIEFEAERDILEGALVYKIQRKHVGSAQDESKRFWLLVAWNGKHTKELDVCALLVEHNKRLDEDRLRKLYQKRWPLFKERANTTKGNWTLNDTTMLTTIRVTNGGYRWDIFISTRQTDEPKNTETIRPNDNSIGSDKINIDKINQVAFRTNNYVKYGFW